MDMLPAGRIASPPTLPISREDSHGNEHQHPILDSSTDIELEAKNPHDPRDPELDAEAPGPHILEMETLEVVHEMESRKHVVEMDGWSKSHTGSEGRSG